MLQKIQKETLEVKIGECSVCLYCMCKCMLGGCREAEVSLQGHTSLFQKLSERGVGCWTDRYKGTCVVIITPKGKLAVLRIFGLE